MTLSKCRMHALWVFWVKYACAYVEELGEEEEEDNLFRYAAMHLMIDGVTSRKDIADFFWRDAFKMIAKYAEKGGGGGGYTCFGT